MENWTAKEFLAYIDEHFNDAKKKGISRMSVEWGKWSREMNLVIRKRLESKSDPEEMFLKYVFVYWTAISQRLELNFKGRILNGGKIKKSAKEAEQIKKIIMKGRAGAENAAFLLGKKYLPPHSWEPIKHMLDGEK